jgi:hypothetical protein
MDDYGESIDAGGNAEFFKSIMKKRKEARKNIMMKKTGSKTKNQVELPTYKVREKDPTYHMKRGKVLEAHSNLHLNKDGKRTITSKVKIWDSLTPSDKASLKKSIMIALEHKFKGGSISDFPKDIQSTTKAIIKHFGGRGIADTGVMDTNDYKNMGSTLAPQTSRNIESGIGGFKKNVMSLKAMADKIKARKGKGFTDNYFKPKGHRQLIYFSDSSSDEDEPYIPVKRGRGRPKCS